MGNYLGCWFRNTKAFLLGGLLGILLGGCTREYVKSNQSHALGKIQNAELAYSNAIVELHSSPVLTNAMKAQWESLKTFAELFGYFDVISKNNRYLLISNFCDHSERCLEGFKKVEGNENLINGYGSNVMRRINLARIMRDHGKYSIVERMLWDGVSGRLADSN